MQDCTRCSILERIKGQICNVYISASEGYLLHKVRETLGLNNVPFTDHNDVLCVDNTSFTEVVELLYGQKGLSEVEKGQVQMFPLLVGEHFKPQHLFSFKTLSAWHELLDAQDLIDIIQHRRVNTYFQPIVNTKSKELFAFECLIRGLAAGDGIIAPKVLFQKAKILDLHFALDKLSRETAIDRAAALGIKGPKLFINFLPTAIYNPQDCLQTTIKTAQRHGLIPANIVFEVVESEKVQDIAHLRGILEFYRAKGFQSALDDFGSGYSSLKMLDELSPDYVKIDMHFIRDIHESDFKQSVIKAIVSIARDKGVMTLAEGIEHNMEFETIKSLGVDLAQGYFLGKPEPEVNQWFTK